MFGVEAWLVWLIVGAIFIISEIFTAGFVMMPLGIAALGSSLIAYLLPGYGLAAQLGAFIVIGIVLIFFGQKLGEKIAKEPGAKVGADRFVAKKAIVTEAIDDSKNSGRVRVAQDEWRARTADGTKIEKGKKVMVKKVIGTHLIVEKL
jgi:membrane protein implicated in regulation of membrane protease activity